MEQVKLIESNNLNLLEGFINSFLSKLDEHTDVIDIRIDAHPVQGSTVFTLTNFICTIRFATYTIDETEPVESEAIKQVSKIENGYPCMLDNINMPKQSDIKLYYPTVSTLKDDE